MKKVVLLLAVLTLTGCAHTKTGETGQSSTTTQEAAQTGGYDSDALVQKYREDLPGVTADTNAVFPQLTTEVADNEASVRLVTSMGNMEMKLFPEIAPLAVENFLTQAKEGQYDGVTIAPAGENFIAQSGPSKKGSSIWNGVDANIDSGSGFANEVSPYLYNLRGAVSMVNSGPNTATSYFFINTNPSDATLNGDLKQYNSKINEAYKNGGNPGLDSFYAVFGQVTSGYTVLDAIAFAQEPVTIEKIEIIKDYTFD